VDYIAEHLQPRRTGRHHRARGHHLPEPECLQGPAKGAVGKLSLGCGQPACRCIQPYSGVKTSILFLDRNLVKRTDEVLFVKVENDGFDLGAQRRPIEKNDLPKALRTMLRCHSGLDPESSIFPNSPVKPGNDKAPLSHFVPRKRLLESPDVNLSGDRYRPAITRAPGKWPMVSIGDLCDLQNGRAFKPSDWEKKEAGGVRLFAFRISTTAGEFNYYSGKVDDRLIVCRGDLLFSWSGHAGHPLALMSGAKGRDSQSAHLQRAPQGNRKRQFFYWMLKKAVEQVEEPSRRSRPCPHNQRESRKNRNPPPASRRAGAYCGGVGGVSEGHRRCPPGHHQLQTYHPY